MDEKLRKYYDNRLSMCGSDAWKDLMEDVESMLAATNTLDGVQNDASLQFKKGEVSIMRWILTLKESSEQSYLKLKE